MDRQQLDLIAQNPQLLREGAVNLAVGMACRARGVGIDGPTTPQVNDLISEVSHFAAAIAENVLRDLEGCCEKYDSLTELLQELAALVLYDTKELPPPILITLPQLGPSDK